MNEWTPKLGEFTELNLFADVTTDIVKVVKKLPYGSLALLIVAVKDILTEEEIEIDPSDYQFYLRIYYFLMGVLSAKDDRDLVVSEEDMMILNDQIDLLATTFSMTEGFFKEVIEAKYVDGEWLFGMSKTQARNYLRNLTKSA